MTLYADIIAVTENELAMRERMAPHISGIPAIQNNSAIARLYDVLVDMHLLEIEAATCGYCRRLLAPEDTYCCPRCGWKVGAK